MSNENSISSERPSGNTPQYYIDAFGGWLGKKITHHPKGQQWALNFVRGAVYAPLVFAATGALAYLTSRIFATRRKIAVTRLREEFREIQQILLTYSLSKRIAVVTSRFFAAVFIVPFLEEAYVRTLFQNYFLLKKEGYPIDVKNYSPRHLKTIRVALSTFLYSWTYLLCGGAENMLHSLPLGFTGSLLQEKYGSMSAPFGLNCAYRGISLALWTPSLLRGLFPSLLKVA